METLGCPRSISPAQPSAQVSSVGSREIMKVFKQPWNTGFRERECHVVQFKRGLEEVSETAWVTSCGPFSETAWVTSRGPFSSICSEADGVNDLRYFSGLPGSL